MRCKKNPLLGTGRRRRWQRPAHVLAEAGVGSSQRPAQALAAIA